MSQKDPTNAREKLSGLFHFAQGLLAARSKVLMRMRETGLGCFLEAEVADLPGVALPTAQESWLVLERLRETPPPSPEDGLIDWVDGRFDDPAKPPRFKSVVIVDVAIEEASDLCEAELIAMDDVKALAEAGAAEERVKVALWLERLPAIEAALGRWKDGPWETWAKAERPVRQSIKLYNSLFKLHNMMHGGAVATPPELVWGIGLARWAQRDTQIDMPLIEQLVDLEVQPGGALAIKPREVRPSLSLKPFLEADVDGASEAQRYLQELFGRLTDSDDQEITPHEPTAWEPLLDAAATRLSPRAKHVTREDMRAGTEIKGLEEDLRIYSTWAIYGRPRSEDLREQDLERLRAQVERTQTDDELPGSLRGFVAPKPEDPVDEGDDWGLTRTTLRSDAGWRGGRSSPQGGKTAPDDTPVGNGQRAAASKVYFFPLAYNEEQAQIIDRLEQEDVVTVTGPPGTGKTHSIANIISHYMATGQRVLVTARTAEAIAAVREKLPQDLANLVIASVASDREGAKQLEDAIQRLSDDVVTLDVARTRKEIQRLEAEVVDIDAATRDCDRQLAEIATLNLKPLRWDGVESTAMETAELIASIADQHDWMTDRPSQEPPATLADTVEHLRVTLPRLAEDVVYLDEQIPKPSALPTTAELLEAHRKEVAHRNRPNEDFAGVPPMARDTANADVLAAVVHQAFDAFSTALDGASDWERAATAAHVQARIRGAEAPQLLATVQAAAGLIRDYAPGGVECDVDAELHESLLAAVARACDGKKPLSGIAALFNRGLADALDNLRVDGGKPTDTADWQRIYDALKVAELREQLEAAWVPHVVRGQLPPLPANAADLVAVIRDAAVRLERLIGAAETALPQAEMLRSLFPYGLAIDESLRGLALAPLLRALRANLKDDYQTPAAIAQLDAIAERGDMPLCAQISALRQALGAEETEELQIVEARTAITQEIERLNGLQGELAALSNDLDQLRAAGAPCWADACLAAPTDVARTLPAEWRTAWAWAMMRGQLDSIIAFGNGDALRVRQKDLRQRRERIFEQLIRERTLLGLKRRLTVPVQTALSTFTTAVRRLGRGTGKNAVRWRKAIRKAAQQAAPAAPVWVMPEYKIAEQLPAELADFDLVILDEASQSDITAIGALARGRKHLIVGDEQQVSPSAVGVPTHKMDVLRAEHLTHLPNRDVIDENTSIFDIAMQMYPKTHLMLREHFRCVEPIIQFSTRFYNGRLVPIRVPKASERFDPPLVDVFVKDGERHGKTNPAEARFIVNEISAIARNPAHAHRDVAVISLIGGEQADLIERMLIEDPRVGTDVMDRLRIVCGDSRTMQGQERSIVFLSMVATPGNAVKQGSQAYAQRFNVALSRARDRLYLVRSVSTHDLKPGDLKLDVLEHFQNPMPEGRTLVGKGVLERCESGFEREVCQMLLDANYRVRSQVKAGPFSIDLVVEGADDRRLAIELDGDAWHGPEKWHEDMARQAALERAGWTFWRVFGSQWLADKDYWWNNLLGALEQMSIAPIGAEASEDLFTEFRIVDASMAEPETAERENNEPETAVKPLATVEMTEPTRFAARHSDEASPPSLQPEQTSGRVDTVASPALVGAAVTDGPASNARPQAEGRPPVSDAPPMQLAPAGASGPGAGTDSDADPRRFYDEDYHPMLRSIGCKIIDRAGPITFKHLSDRIARLHGFQRTGSEIKRVVWTAMNGARQRSREDDDMEIYWPEGTDVVEWIDFRGLKVDGEARSLHDVPLPERLGLAREILKQEHPEPDLAIGRALGLSRLRTKTRWELNDLLGRAREMLKREGHFDRADDNVTYIRKQTG